MVATTLWNMVGSRERMDDNHHEFAHDDNDNDNIRVLLQEPLLQEEEEEEGLNKNNINKSNDEDDDDNDNVHKRGVTIHSYYLWLGIMVGMMAQLVWYDVIMVALLTVLTQSFSVRIAMAVTLVLILTKFVLSIMICIQLPSDDDDDDKNNNDDVDDQLEQEFMAYDDNEPLKRHADDQPRRTQEQEPQQQQQAKTSLSSSLSSQRAIGCFCMGVLVGICIAIVIVDGLLLLDNQPLYSWHYFQAVVSTSRH